MAEPPPIHPRGPYLKQTRRERDPKKRPPFEFRDRDRNIIEAVWRHRFLSLSLLQLLFPPELHPSTARALPLSPRSGTNLGKRLQGLYKNYYLERVRVARTGPVQNLEHRFVYSLGRRGALELKAKYPDLPICTDNPDHPNPAYIDHALSVARLGVFLTHATPSHPPCKLLVFTRAKDDLPARWVLPEPELPPLCRHKHHELDDDSSPTRRFHFSINPDARFTLRDTHRQADRQRLPFLVEVDRSTMTIERLREKFVHYAIAYDRRIHQTAYRIPSFRVLIVTKSPERALNLLELAATKMKPEHRKLFWFVPEPAYLDHPENLLASIYRTADTASRLLTQLERRKPTDTFTLSDWLTRAPTELRSPVATPLPTEKP